MWRDEENMAEKALDIEIQGYIFTKETDRYKSK